MVVTGKSKEVTRVTCCFGQIGISIEHSYFQNPLDNLSTVGATEFWAQAYSENLPPRNNILKSY